MSGARSRNRGAESERMVVAYLRSIGYPDARRYLAGDGRQPGDIDAIPGVCIEVKAQTNSTSWPSWVRQAVNEAGPDRVPVVVRRTPRSTLVAEWTAVAVTDGMALDVTACLGRDVRCSPEKALKKHGGIVNMTMDVPEPRWVIVGSFVAVLTALDAYPVGVER